MTCLTPLLREVTPLLHELTPLLRSEHTSPPHLHSFPYLLHSVGQQFFPPKTVMDDSMLLELTKCFARVSRKQDGTFLKMWCEGGAFRFHMSNNNISRQSTFRHPSFNQHTVSTSSTMSTPDPRPSTLEPGPSTLSTPDLAPICKQD